MEALRAEIDKKRKALEDNAGAPRPTKYMRRGDIEKMKQDQEAKERKLKADIAKQEADLAVQVAQEARVAAIAKRAVEIAKKSPATKDDTPEADAAAVIPFNISNEETVQRLRAKGQPIRLFAEEDKDRRLRLRALELIEERGTTRQGGQNDFKKAMEDMANNEQQLKNKGESSTSKPVKKAQPEAPVGSLDVTLIQRDPNALYPLIYHALKKVLKEWGEAMDERPEAVKRTAQGKQAAATQVLSAEYLKPLFKSLRARSLPADVLARMAEIVHYMQERRYQRANDSYLRLSIGNAPWPIGVTMVGIHERSAREKISSDQVAHVLNDEVSRKYIQSLKRLLTFSQTKYPPEDISQLMG